MIDSLFGSKTRVKLLRLFFLVPTEAYYVREITRKIDEQINSVRRELKNLLEVGIIKSKAVGNQLYYSANENYDYFNEFARIFGDIKEVKAKKEQDLSEFMAIGDIKAIIQTGKLSGNNSDVDLLIVGDNINKTRLKFLIKNMEKDGLPINYVVMKFEDFYYRVSIKDRFIYETIGENYTVLLDIENVLKNKEEEKEE